MSLMDQLANALDKPPSSIEILPDGYPFQEGGLSDPRQEVSPFLFIEGNLGIPKKALYRTYVDALVIFSSAKKCVLGDVSPSITLALRELVASSAVILLANPAHLTALNARKRLIQGRHRDPRRELEYIAALLSSRNCANQSVLWHHRQWLLRRIYGLPDDFLQPSSDVEVSSSTLSQDVINNEFSIASKACSIYPRNYFGWSHRHFCIQLVFYVLASAADPTYVEELTMLLSDEVVFMRRWIEQHISDSSAVHYLTTLLRRLDDAGLMDAVPFTLPSTPDNAAPTWAKGLSSSVDHAISLVQSYPDHESLWLYLRAGSCQGETQTRDIQSLSRSFIYPWACQSLSPSGYDSREVTIHAYRFLAWLAFKAGRLIINDKVARDIIAGDPRTRPAPSAF